MQKQVKLYGKTFVVTFTTEDLSIEKLKLGDTVLATFKDENGTIIYSVRRTIKVYGNSKVVRFLKEDLSFVQLQEGSLVEINKSGNELK